MITSERTIECPALPSSTPNSACVYLLVSRLRPDIYKLGLADHLPARLVSLRYSFGDFDLHSSSLVGAVSRREALRLEQLLATYFRASHWRATAPIVSPVSAPGASVSNGHQEWYQREAFEPILGVVADLIAQDAAGATARFALHRRIPAAWWDLGLPAAAPANWAERQRRREEAAREMLAAGEEAFRNLKAWVDARRGRLLAVSPPAEDARGVLWRTLTFATPAEMSREDVRRGRGEWDALWPWACLRCRTRTNINIQRNFLHVARLPEESDMTYVIEFAICPFFRTVSPEELVPVNDLPRRIWDWVAGPQAMPRP